MSRRHYVRKVECHGMVFHGKKLPRGAVYGRCKTSRGVCNWYCDDIRFFKDKSGTEYIWVYIFDSDINRWVTKNIYHGEIFRDFEKFVMNGGAKLWEECENILDYKNTYQYQAPFGRKHKNTTGKECQKRHEMRGENGGKYSWELREETGLLSTGAWYMTPQQANPKELQRRDYLNAHTTRVEWVNGVIYPK